MASPKLCDAVMGLGRKIAAEARSRYVLTRRELVIDQGLRVGGPEAALNIGRGPGETLAILTALPLDADETGTIARCIAADANTNGRPATKAARTTPNTHSLRSSRQCVIALTVMQ